MSRRTVTCVEWVCDDCDEAFEYDNSTIHFHPDESMPEEWEVIDGKDVCESCRDRRVCAAEGHLWTGWQLWYTPPGAPKEEHRDCRRCNEGETRHV